MSWSISNSLGGLLREAYAEDRPANPTEGALSRDSLTGITSVYRQGNWIQLNNSLNQPWVQTDPVYEFWHRPNASGNDHEYVVRYGIDMLTAESLRQTTETVMRQQGQPDQAFVNPRAYQALMEEQHQYTVQQQTFQAGRMEQIHQMHQAGMLSGISMEQQMLRGMEFDAVYIDELYQEPHDKLFYHCDGCAAGGPCGD